MNSLSLIIKKEDAVNFLVTSIYYGSWIEITNLIGVNYILNF